MDNTELNEKADNKNKPNKQELTQKVREFIGNLLDHIMKENGSAKGNEAFKNYYEVYKKSKTAKDNKKKASSGDDQMSKIKNEHPNNLKELISHYKDAGEAFVAHTCTMTYKLLSSAKDKQEDLSQLAKDIEAMSSGDDSNKYLKDIKDINERKAIDAGAFTLGLAVKYKEADKSKKSPYAAKNTKEALSLAAQYRKSFPKYYQKIMNAINDAYNQGISEAHKKLRNGEKLNDPFTGEQIGSEIIAPLWGVGSKLNKFFSSQPTNVVTLAPKLIFGVYNLLTSDTAKGIYKGLAKFGRAIYQKFKNPNGPNGGNPDEGDDSLFDCSVEKLSTEFNDIVNKEKEEKKQEQPEEKPENQPEQKKDDGKKDNNGEQPQNPPAENNKNGNGTNNNSNGGK